MKKERERERIILAEESMISIPFFEAIYDETDKGKSSSPAARTVLRVRGVMRVVL